MTQETPFDANVPTIQSDKDIPSLMQEQEQQKVIEQYIASIPERIQEFVMLELLKRFIMKQQSQINRSVV